jgi:polysaccharide biosynthesis/export protein
MLLSRLLAVGLLSVLAGSSSLAAAVEAASSKAADHAGNSRDAYQLQPGDVIDVSVWKETDLQREVLVRPDGGFTFPLAGEIDARGKSVENIRSILAERLQKYVPTPVVTVAVKSIGGNRVYVLGKVIRAGDFPLSAPLDVMQAISLAGGTTPYAAVNDIVILRRQNGRQQAFNFKYSDVARGRNLAQNIQLESGDTVVVP